MDEILYCHHSNETSSAVLSHGTICFSACYKKEIGKFSRIFTLATSGIKRNTKRAPLLSAHFLSHQMSLFTRNLTVEWCVESYFAFALVTVKPANKEGQ